MFSLSDYPESTAYKAGNLTSINAGWRSKRPIINTNQCVGCFQCYLYCPDGVISKKGSVVSVDYDYCKGCGICHKMCKLDAIYMVDEEGGGHKDE